MRLHEAGSAIVANKARFTLENRSEDRIVVPRGGEAVELRLLGGPLRLPAEVLDVSERGVAFRPCEHDRVIRGVAFPAVLLVGRAQVINLLLRAQHVEATRVGSRVFKAPPSWKSTVQRLTWASQLGRRLREVDAALLPQSLASATHWYRAGSQGEVLVWRAPSGEVMAVEIHAEEAVCRYDGESWQTGRLTMPPALPGGLSASGPRVIYDTVADPFALQLGRWMLASSSAPHEVKALLKVGAPEI